MLHRLFVYDSLLSGETQHDLLAGASKIGAAETETGFDLVDLGAYGALVPCEGEATGEHVIGELYALERPSLLQLDVVRQVPILFDRARIRLRDGSEADAYVMGADRVRGRRRLRPGDWRKRFTGHVRPIESSFARWARGRFDRG